jgi:mannose-1-phosphate guanylyltransferase
MRAVVLVGGFGTRLRPLTYRTPKPMLPVGHRPMIEVVVDQLARGGVTDVVLALGFKPEPFREAFPDGRCAGVPLTYAVEPEPLDTAGAIRFAARFSGIDETFLVVNGDVLCDLDVRELVAFHRRSGAEGTLHLTAVENPSAFGVVEIGEHGMVRRFVEKPAPGTEPSNLINAGTYVLEPAVLDRIPEGRKVSVERETFPAMVAEGTLFALPTADYWLDTGQPRPYLQANLDVLEGRRRHVRCVGVAPGALVSPEAVVERSLVGPRAVVGPGCRIVAAVLLPGAVVEDGATVVSSVVAGRVGAGASIEDCVVGADGRVDPRVVLVHARVPEPEP